MRIACAIALVMCLTPSVRAEQQGAAESAIRLLIDGENAGKSIPRTPDVVFWSGALTRPVVGKETPTYAGGTQSVPNRVPGSQRTKITPLRIDVSQSGDMAWEYSTGRTSFELKDGTKVQFDTSQLRVWRKSASGQWMIAAHFVRPHEDPARQ